MSTRDFVQQALNNLMWFEAKDKASHEVFYKNSLCFEHLAGQLSCLQISDEGVLNRLTSGQLREYSILKVLRAARCHDV